MPTPRKKTVLFCPLDWGLGHIARDLPLIREFHGNGHRVIVAASDSLCQWLRSEAPNIETVLFEGPQIRYSPKGFSFSRMIFQLPNLVSWLKKEKKITQKLVTSYQPDLIISDNRYGARLPHVFSIIITHQLCIKLPKGLKWCEYPLHLMVKQLVKKFNQCWIPDFHYPESLAGELVHKYPIPSNAILIGPLSRFDGLAAKSHKNGQPSILSIISGPEPQRSIFEKILKEALIRFNGKKTLIRGKTRFHDDPTKKNESINLLNHQPTEEMAKLIHTHQLIISRSGYSSIMDMYYLNRKILMVPTPGQTEQEYLASYHNQKTHLCITQNKISKTNWENLTSKVSILTPPHFPLYYRSVLKKFFCEPPV